jgi:hypothetical protein
MLDRLTDVILQFRKGPIVEIGIGRSTRILSEIAQRHGVKLYSCDKKNFSQLFNDHVIYIGKSFEFMEQFNDIPAVVFLDGNHNYDVVKKETEFFLPKLMDGGVIFMHDTLPPTLKHLSRDKCSSSYKLRKEMELNSEIDCFTWPYSANNCGLTMIMQNPKCAVDE